MKNSAQYFLKQINLSYLEFRVTATLNIEIQRAFLYV